jgi:hypothetical protein
LQDMYQYMHLLLQVTVALRMVDVSLNSRIVLHLTVQMKVGAGARLNTRCSVRPGSDPLLVQAGCCTVLEMGKSHP